MKVTKRHHSPEIKPDEGATLGILLLLSIGVVLLLALSGCTTPVEGARTLLDRLEFEAGEYGTFELEGNVDLNPIPLITTNVHMKLEKIKDKPAQADDAPAP